jgi:hypothetical protein
MALKNPYAAGFAADTGEAASLGANQADFFGEGLAGTTAAAPDAGPQQLGDAAARNKLTTDATSTANINALSDRTSGTGAPLAAGGGATGAYEAGNDSGRAQYDYMHSLNSPSSVGDFFNSMGESVGISHAGDAAGLTGGLHIQNPLDFNPVSQILDPNKGLGTTVGNDGSAGKPISNIAPEAAALASQGIVKTTGQAAGDALTQAMGGLGGSDIPVDGSGNDRGGMGLNGAYSDNFARAQNLGDQSRAKGQGVLDGSVAPGGAGAGGQQDVLDAAMSFLPSAQQGAAARTAGFTPSAQQAATGQVNAYQAGPRAQSGVMSQLDQFAQQPAGPSAAELQLQQGAQGNMSDALSLARSGRSRDAGSQARNLNVAQAQNAATNVDTTRDTALLRANEAATQRAQNLQALGQKGQLAQGVDSGTLQALGLGSDLAKGTDQSTLGALGIGADLAKGIDTSTLGALGLSGDVATALRAGNTAERGQTLNYAQGQDQIGAGLEGDVLKTIPQLENIRHADQFDLTPQQKLAAAKLGGPPEKTTADYVTGLLGDVLSAI